MTNDPQGGVRCAVGDGKGEGQGNGQQAGEPFAPTTRPSGSNGSADTLVSPRVREMERRPAGREVVSVNGRDIGREAAREKM